MADEKGADSLPRDGDDHQVHEPTTTTTTTNGASSTAALASETDAEKTKTSDTSAAAAQPPQKSKSNKGPPGGFDSTPIPAAPPGWTVKFTFHSAKNLPMADFGTFSSDPFVEAQLYTSLPTRHKEDPPLKYRTPTVRRCTNPQWESDWIVANVPSSGFRLKARLYDEDPADKDDRLGNAHVVIPRIDEERLLIRKGDYKIKKRMASKRAYIVRILASCMDRGKKLHGLLTVSVEVLGRTQVVEGEDGGRAYTVGPQWWVRHYSPLLGRITGVKDTGGERRPSPGGTSVQRYNFQANEMQLRGPVPAALYHRYVEFKPFVKSMFTARGVGGFLLSHALHHQHARVYNYDSSTLHGKFDEPCEDMTAKFLDLAHYDKGGRIYTYVITLDGVMRFTETGKEFGIDMLSKHTMHSDVSIYIAFSGEFFVRRLKHKHHPSKSSASLPASPQPDQSVDKDNEKPHHGSSPKLDEDVTHPPYELPNGPPTSDPPHDPRYYELIIDNDSGTYRPNAALLPVLKAFLSANFPGLLIRTLDCQADADLMAKMKHEQRDRKQRETRHMVFTQFNPSSSSLGSISSSDEEALDHLEKKGVPRQRSFLAIANDQIQAREKKRARKRELVRRQTTTDFIPVEEQSRGANVPVTQTRSHTHHE